MEERLSLVLNASGLYKRRMISCPCCPGNKLWGEEGVVLVSLSQGSGMGAGKGGRHRAEARGWEALEG